MKRILTLVLAALVLVSTVASGAALAQTQTPVDTPDQAENTTTPAEDGDANETDTNESESQAEQGEAPPGLQIAATMGAMSESIESTLDRYALGHQLQNAESSEEKQKIINNFVAEQQEELNKSAQDAEDDNQSNARKQYSAAMNVIEAQNAKENANYAQKMAEKHGVGVNKTKLQQLKNNANNMTGQEVSALARSLAGPPEHANGNGAGERGPPAHAGEDDENDTEVEVNETVATEKLETAEAALADARNSSNVSNETLTEVEADLTEARSLLEEARNLSETTTENETETENSEESDIEEERQELYEEVYEISVDSIEKLEESSEESTESEETEPEDDSETDDEVPGNGNGNAPGN